VVTLVCAGCGNAITDKGWRCYPARPEGGTLVGTTGELAEAAPIGEAVDLCTACVPVEHPMKADADADGD